jgi:mono/diheme cytochrome c family protein
MGEAVENSLQYLDPDDALALAAWLRTAIPLEGRDPIYVDPRPAPALASTAAAPASGATPVDAIGPRLFAGACASCHEWSGPGRQTPYASLLGSRSVNDPEGTNLTQVILHGAGLRLHDADVLMPAFASTYSDFEVAALANYVIGHYGAKKGEVTPQKVAQLRASR